MSLGNLLEVHRTKLCAKTKLDIFPCIYVSVTDILPEQSYQENVVGTLLVYFIA